MRKEQRTPNCPIKEYPMKMKPMLILVLALAAAGTVFGDITEKVMPLFNDFLGWLTAKHEALESLAMPGIEVRGPPGEEDMTKAAVILTFEDPGDAGTFATALRAENIPFGTFPERAGTIILFSIDIISFVMQDAIGL
jgi:hypothetical protein